MKDTKSSCSALLRNFFSVLKFCHFYPMTKLQHFLNKTTQKSNKRAFTLAELLTAILIISIIMVALAPVITKRMKDSVSVVTDNKKGLEIFANPGIYTFDVPIGINTLFIQGAGGGGGGGGAAITSDINVTKTSSSSWTVPKGVNQITLKITGSGGGGGGSNGTATPSAHPKTNLLTQTACASDEFLAVRGASNEKDLCITRYNLQRNTKVGTMWGSGLSIIKHGDTCTSQICCWEDLSYYCTSASGYSGCGKTVCTSGAANTLCTWHYSSSRDIAHIFRLPDLQELQKISKYFLDWAINKGASGLQMCSHNDNYGCSSLTDATKIPVCGIGGGCKGATADYCSHSYIWGAGGYWAGRHTPCNNYLAVGYSPDSAASVRCVREISKYTPYHGAGGASGAIMEKNINVLPGDVFTITVGAGGGGGGARAKGSQGAATKVVHTRGGVELGTYQVLGGLGGNAATTSAHGAAYVNGTANGQSTPGGTCYARYRKKTTDSFSGGNVGCNYPSYSGEAGGLNNLNKGGNGGRVLNTGNIANGTPSGGGYLHVDDSRTAYQRNTGTEATEAKGKDASTPGFGGGGGLTPNWAQSSSNFYGGGRGANGKVEILYKIALPGSGGGSGARVAGTEESTNVDYEIKYKVKEGDRIVVEVGSGGAGGVAGQNGTNGTPTVVGDSKIVFLAGEAGKAVTQSQKDSVVSCVQSAGSNAAIANCVNNTSRKPAGGKSGIIGEDNVTRNTTLGLLTSGNISYTKSPSTFKGQDGNIPAQVSANTTPWSYGFDGGVGGAPFGIRKTNVSVSVTCGGGMVDSYGNELDIVNYVCTSGNINANDAKPHDAANNEFGGSGGGGGGVVDTSFDLGSGGNGANGYLRIRWDESEQE